MKNYLVFFGAWLIIQPTVTLGIISSADEKKDIETVDTPNLQSTIEYKNNQIIITKPNQRKKEETPAQVGNTQLSALENYLARMESEPKLTKGETTTTLLGQKMKRLSKSFLFTG